MAEHRSSVFDNAICISVTLKKFGTTRKVSTEVVDVDSDKKLLKLSKRILECPAIEEIEKIYTAIRDHLKRFGIVNALMKGGMYLIPMDFVERTESFLREQQEALDYWKYQISEQYDAAKSEFRSRLGELYSESDYPSADALRGKFSIDYEFLAMDVPQALSYISHSIFQREQEKAQARVQVVAERVEQILTESMHDLVSHLVDRLTDIDNGKRKVWRGDMVDKAREFFETFKSRNLTGAESLNNLADQGLDLLRGVDLESLKDNNASVRERVRLGFEQIKSSMASMIVVAPRRALNLNDELNETPAGSDIVTVHTVESTPDEAEISQFISDAEMSEQIELSNEIVAEVVAEERAQSENDTVEAERASYNGQRFGLF